MKNLYSIFLLVCSVFSIYSFTNEPELVAKSNTEKSIKKKTSTYASYYHDKFNGKLTASGEVFDNSKLTAANKTLPFGTLVKVTNLETGSEVIVRINDRGPYHSTREIDLSLSAFQQIGDPDSGVIPVEFEVIE